jgi:hypothetical protein
VLRSEKVSRLRRWLYQGLHSFDFPFRCFERPLWDGVVVVLSMGGVTLSVTTMLPAWLRLRAHAGREVWGGRVKPPAWWWRSMVFAIVVLLCDTFPPPVVPDQFGAVALGTAGGNATGRVSFHVGAVRRGGPRGVVDANLRLAAPHAELQDRPVVRPAAR